MQIFNIYNHKTQPVPLYQLVPSTGHVLQLQVICSILAGAKILSLLQSINIRTGVHPSSYSWILAVMRPIREADHL
jgi:hypothetical protein